MQTTTVTKTIGFVIAMQQEFEALSFAFNNNLTTTVNNKPFVEYTCNYNNIKLVAIISGIGKTLSASATTYLIHKHKPNLVINVGSSGGVSPAKVGDIVLSCNAGFFDVDVTAFGYKLGQVPKQESIFNTLKHNVGLQSLVNSLLNNNIISGSVATGDCFVSDIKIVKQIKALYNNIACIEMEAASIALVGSVFNTDVLFIKKISDLADEKATADFSLNIQNMQQNLQDLLHSLLNNIEKYIK